MGRHSEAAEVQEKIEMWSWLAAADAPDTETHEKKGAACFQ